MSNGEPAERQPGERQPGHDRRAATRDKARRLREKQRKHDRRTRVLVQGGIGLGILAVLAIVALVIVGSVRPPQPGPANMASDGILIGKGLKAVRTASVGPEGKPVVHTPDPSGSTVSIVTYIDYLCPYCGEFEKTNGAQIQKLVSSGAATVEIHPIPLLASHSAGTKYSLRATNAAACVANYSPNSFFKLNALLFANQPTEDSAGLTDAQIKDLVKKSGAADLGEIMDCMDNGRFNNWAQAALDRALAGPIPNSKVGKLKGTPLVLVNGQEYTGDLRSAAAFRAFVVQAQGNTYSTATPTPTPTPAATP